MKALLEAFAPYRKSVAAFFGLLGAGVGAALSDGDLTSGEVLTALGVTMAATFAVYRVPNAPKKD